MTEKTVNGDCIDVALKEIVMAFNTVRGNFYPDKDYGSHIKNATKLPVEFYVLCYARQALYDMNGIFIKSVSINNKNYDFVVIVNNEERQVRITV